VGDGGIRVSHRPVVNHGGAGAVELHRARRLRALPRRPSRYSPPRFLSYSLGTVCAGRALPPSAAFPLLQVTVSAASTQREV
jgi:hypothetical protein